MKSKSRYPRISSVFLKRYAYDSRYFISNHFHYYLLRYSHNPIHATSWVLAEHGLKPQWIIYLSCEEIFEVISEKYPQP